MTARETAPRLGRGLAALFGDAAAPPSIPDAAPRTALPVASLEPGPFQPRMSMDPAALDDLVASIRQQGVLQPLLARPHPTSRGRYQIIAGERRWRASQAAGLHEVPVLIRPLSDTEAMAAALVENLQRQDLDPIEEAEGYRRLLNEFGVTQDRLGAAVGKSRSHIANAIRLLQLPPNVRAHLRTGALSAGHARALLAHPEPEAAAQAVIARGLNVRQTEALANGSARAADRGRRASRDTTAPETEAVARELTERLGLRVRIEFDGRGGSVRIDYRDLDQLDGLLALLKRE